MITYSRFMQGTSLRVITGAEVHQTYFDRPTRERIPANIVVSSDFFRAKAFCKREATIASSRSSKVESFFRPPDNSGTSPTTARQRCILARVSAIASKSPSANMSSTYVWLRSQEIAN